jgi:hypothetical protein
MKDIQEPPSDEFNDAVRDSGTCCAVECGFCGRVHFVSGRGHGDYDTGELEKLQAKAKAEPEKYLEESLYDVISTGWIDGREAVIGCPCNALRRYEDYIWSNRLMICKYLAARAGNQVRTIIGDATVISHGIQAVCELTAITAKAQEALNKIQSVSEGL